MSPRALLLAGVMLAALSLGLPWGTYAGLPGYLTMGYYTAGYCDASYCYGGSYVPGYYVPGYSGGTFAGAESSARFFIVGAAVLAFVGWRLGRDRLLRGAALVALAGVLVHLTAGLTGGAVCLAAAGACFWVAAGAVRVSPYAS